MSDRINPAAIASSLYASYNRHDTAAVAQLYNENTIHVDIAHGRPKSGPLDIAEGLEHFRVYLNRENALSFCFDTIQDGKPLRTFPGIGLSKFLQWFPDAVWDVGPIMASDDDHVAIAYTLTGTLQSAMGPVEPRGQKISLQGVQVVALSNGQIQRSEDYWDASTFQKQLNSNTREERP